MSLGLPVSTPPLRRGFGLVLTLPESQTSIGHCVSWTFDANCAKEQRDVIWLFAPTALPYGAALYHGLSACKFLHGN